MEAIVVYASVLGNTHRIADAIREGLADSLDAEVLPADEATPDRLEGVDLLVVGGPTHMHGMARSSSRSQGVKVEKDKEATGDPAHEIDEQAYGESLREWFHDLGRGGSAAAAFDTRFDAAPTLTGRASKGIARRLRHHGWSLVADGESFLVDKENELLEGEEDRARQWGRSLAAGIAGG